MDDRFEAGQADVLQDLKMFEIAVIEMHPETGLADSGNPFNQGLQFFVIDQVHSVGAGFGKDEIPLDAERFYFQPFTILPVDSRLDHLLDIDCRIEVGGKGQAVTAAVAVQDINGMNLVKEMLGSMGAEDIGDPGIKAHTEQRGETGLTESFPEGELPSVGKHLITARVRFRG